MNRRVIFLVLRPEKNQGGPVDSFPQFGAGRAATGEVKFLKFAGMDMPPERGAPVPEPVEEAPEPEPVEEAPVDDAPLPGPTEAEEPVDLEKPTPDEAQPAPADPQALPSEVETAEPSEASGE